MKGIFIGHEWSNYSVYFKGDSYRGNSFEKSEKDLHVQTILVRGSINIGVGGPGVSLLSFCKPIGSGTDYTPPLPSPFLQRQRKTRFIEKIICYYL